MNIYDIAKKAGVSIATISRVINGSSSVSDKTREKVNQVMAELGYTPNIFARGLMVNSMKVLGILTIDVRDFYYANAIHTIELEARQRGYDILLCSTGQDINEKKKYLKLLLQKRVDGIILVGSVFKERANNSHILEASQKAPVVLINGNVEGQNIYSVMCDDYNAIYKSVNFLFDQGHKDIIYLYDVDTFSGMEKVKGFKDAMTHKGFELRKNTVIKAAKGLEGGMEAADKIIDSAIPCTALIAAEDILAAGALKRFQEKGIKVPDDVSIIGFNNSLVSQCTTPELTTVDNKVHAVSSLAVKTLIDVIEGKNVPSRTVLSSEMVIRKTTSVLY